MSREHPPIPRPDGFSLDARMAGPEFREATHQIEAHIATAITAREAGYDPEEEKARTSKRSAAVQAVTQMVHLYDREWFPRLYPKGATKAEQKAIDDERKAREHADPHPQRSEGRGGVRTRLRYRILDASAAPEEQGQRILYDHMARGLRAVAAVRSPQLHAMRWTIDEADPGAEALRKKDWSAELHPANIKELRRRILLSAGEEDSKYAHGPEDERRVKWGGNADKMLRSGGLAPVVDTRTNSAMIAAYFGIPQHVWAAHRRGEILAMPADILDTVDFLMALDDRVLDIMAHGGPARDMEPFKRIDEIPKPSTTLKVALQGFDLGPLEEPRRRKDRDPRTGHGSPDDTDEEGEGADEEDSSTPPEPPVETEATKPEDDPDFWRTRVVWRADIPVVHGWIENNVSQAMASATEPLTEAAVTVIVNSTIEQYLTILQNKHSDRPMDELTRGHLALDIRAAVNAYETAVRAAREKAAPAPADAEPAKPADDPNVVDAEIVEDEKEGKGAEEAVELPSANVGPATVQRDLRTEPAYAEAFEAGDLRDLRSHLDAMTDAQRVTMLNDYLVRAGQDTITPDEFNATWQNILTSYFIRDQYLDKSLNMDAGADTDALVEAVKLEMLKA